MSANEMLRITMSVARYLPVSMVSSITTGSLATYLRVNSDLRLEEDLIDPKLGNRS